MFLACGPTDIDQGDARFVHQVIHADGQFVAVGSDGQRPALSDETVHDIPHGPVVWRSDDGVVWERAFFGGSTGTVQSVAEGGGTWLAVGTDLRPGASRLVRDNTILRSTDGRTWTSLEVPTVAEAPTSLA